MVCVLHQQILSKLVDIYIDHVVIKLSQTCVFFLKQMERMKFSVTSLPNENSSHIFEYLNRND